MGSYTRNPFKVRIDSEGYLKRFQKTLHTGFILSLRKGFRGGGGGGGEISRCKNGYRGS